MNRGGCYVITSVLKLIPLNEKKKKLQSLSSRNIELIITAKFYVYLNVTWILYLIYTFLILLKYQRKNYFSMGTMKLA